MKRAPDIAVIPAAGFARRLNWSGGSKEVMPVAFRGGNERPLGAWLLDDLARAAIPRAHWIVRKEKADIERTFGALWQQSLALTYQSTLPTTGVPHTIDSAFAVLEGKTCALGWPDILLPVEDAYERLSRALNASDAEVMLGLFPTDQPSQVDVVECEDGVVQKIVPKPEDVRVGCLTWAPAVWRPSFTDYLHAALPRIKTEREPYLGDVIQGAINDGMNVRGIQLADAPSVDVGTPEGLRLLRL